MKTSSISLLTTIAYYLSFITLGLAIAVEGPSLPALARHTGTQLNEISLIFVFGSFGYLIGSFFGGQALDRLPGHRFLSLSMMVTAAAITLVPVLSSLWQLLLVVLVLGLAKGALDVGCNTLLQWLHGEKVGPFMNGLHFCFGVGAFLAPLLLAGVLSATADVHWVFWTIALLNLPLAAWFWTLPDPPHLARAEERGGVAVPLLPVFLIVLTFFLYVGAEIGFGNWIYTYALTLGLGTAQTAAYLTSAFWGTFTIGRLAGVWVSTRLRSGTILSLDLAGCLLSLALIMLARDSAALLWAGSIGLGLSMASIFPTTLMFAGERLRVSGAVTGWFLVGSGVGGMFLPWFIGQMFVALGPGSMVTIIFAVVCANLLIFLSLANLKLSPVISTA